MRDVRRVRANRARETCCRAEAECRRVCGVRGSAAALCGLKSVGGSVPGRPVAGGSTRLRGSAAADWWDRRRHRRLQRGGSPRLSRPGGVIGSSGTGDSELLRRRQTGQVGQYPTPPAPTVNGVSGRLTGGGRRPISTRSAPHRANFDARRRDGATLQSLQSRQLGSPRGG